MKNIYKLLFFLLAITYSYGIKSQTWLMNIDSEKTTNFYTYQKAFNDYWKDKTIDYNDEENNCEMGGWQQFKRWENFIEPRVYPSGNYYEPTVLWEEWVKYNSKHKTSGKSANWSSVGPYVVPGNGGGNGRINCISFHPTDPNTFWIGAPNGGIWKTINGGSSWTSLNANLLANIAVSGIAVDPFHPDTIYISTGDGYGYEVDNIFWGGTYTAGVLKSTNGGITWNSTGLTYNQSQNNIIQRLVVCRANPQVILASARDGLWRSADGGATWTAIETTHFYDIKFNTANDSVLYASSEYDIYKSTNLGLTWTQITSGLNSSGGRISLAVTQANSQVIYAFCNGSSGNTFFKSSNGGASFTPKTSPDGAGSFYGYYDMVLAASPVNENTVYTGGMEVIKSTDGGTTWNAVSDWSGWPNSNYVHADNHYIDFLPGSGTTVFSCNDGGIFKTTDGASTWSDLTNGIEITQFYRVSSSATDPDIVFLGAQDNGTNKYDGTNWTLTLGGDGMEPIVDYTNSSIVYASSQGGNIEKSTDGGASFINVSPTSGGAWTTPYAMSAIDHQTLFAGYTDVYKTTDGGASWNAISTNLTGGQTLRTLKVSQSNPNYIYAGILGALYFTSNGGTSWSDISSGLPTGVASITSIAISDHDPLSVWVTFSGYSSGNKVYFSNTGGASWSNVSGTLPNIPVDCIVYQNSSPDALYIGTDFGVYYMDNTMSDWVSYSNGLPNVIVDDLDIQYGVSKLRAATYGRGLWETDVNSVIYYTYDAGVYSILSLPASSCDTVITPVIRLKNFGTDTLTSVNVNYSLDGGTLHTFPWTGSLAQFSYYDITLPAMNVAPGNHSITSYTTSPDGQTDANTANDSKTFPFTVVGNGIALPLMEGFEGSTFPPTGWSASSWIHSTSAGGFGNSSSSTYVNFYNMMTSLKGNLYTDYCDFSSMPAPIKLSFDVAYAPYNHTYSDSLSVNISTDCGITWTRLWIKGGTTLATAPADTLTEYVPSASEWRTEIIDLSSYAGSSRVKINFEGISGYGNDCYVDNINISNLNNINEPTLNNDDVTIFPNPSTGIFYININSSYSKLNSISIYDALGNCIKQITTNNTNKHFPVDLSSLAKGVYMVKIETDNFITNKRIAIIK